MNIVHVRLCKMCIARLVHHTKPIAFHLHQAFGPIYAYHTDSVHSQAESIIAVLCPVGRTTLCVLSDLRYVCHYIPANVMETD